MNLIQKIKGLKLQATANQNKTLDDGTVYRWADEQAILEVLDPVLAEHDAYIQFCIDNESGDNVVVMEMFLSGHSIMKRSVLIGETRNNNEFTARCTTIRRDMMSMLFGISFVVNNDTEKIEITAAIASEKTNESEAFTAALKKIELAKTNDALLILEEAVRNSKKLDGDEKMSLFKTIADKIENGDSIE